MSEKYTRGPWKTEGEGIHAIIRGGDATIVAVRHRLPADVHEANARRIVACVNACEGISTENLEDNRPVKWAIQQYNNVVKQRDELLKALMLAESVYRQNCVNEGEPSSVLDAMQAAILKATGKKA